jgi:hypothetical protein
MKKIAIFLSLFLLAVASVYPQGRGGAQGQQQGRGQSQGSAQAGQRDMTRERIRTTRQQQDQIRSCDKLADGIRKQAREMARTSAGKFKADEARKQRDGLREQVRTMEREHERLIQGLEADQHQAWQERIRNVNRLREQVNSQLEQMDGDLNAAEPDAKRISERAREMERIVSEWRKHYGAMSSGKTS